MHCFHHLLSKSVSYLSFRAGKTGCCILLFQDLSGSLLYLAEAFQLHLLSIMKQCPCLPKRRSNHAKSSSKGFPKEHSKHLYLHKQVYSEKITRIVEDISGLNLLEVISSPYNSVSWITQFWGPLSERVFLSGLGPLSAQSWVLFSMVSF